MPATYFWQPSGTASFLDPTDWLMGPGVPYAPHSQVPDWDDDLYFEGNVTQASCVIPDGRPIGSNGLAFNGIHLIHGLAANPEPMGGTSPPPPPGSPPTEPVGYWGTVFLHDSFAVGTLTVECGIIHQADAGAPTGIAGTLTITSNLNWTGGTLNNNTVAGTIALAPGATGVAEPSFTNPGINQTVSLGSTIELLGPPVSSTPTPGLGSSLDVLSGVYNISNEVGFVVNNQCSLNMLPDPDDAPRQEGGGGGAPQQALVAHVELTSAQTEKKKDGSVTVEKGGQAFFKPRARPAESVLPARYISDGFLKNTGGAVEILDTTEVVLNGSTEIPISGLSCSVYQTYDIPNDDTVFQIEGGCSVLTKEGTSIQNGKFQILTATRDPLTQNFATIGLTPGSTSTYALLFGGSLSMPGGHVRGLQVNGNMLWSGGTIELYLSYTPDRSSDWVRVFEGNLEIINTPTLKLKWNETGMVSQAKDSIWHLIKVEGAGKEITGAYTVDYADVNTQGNIVMDVSTTGNKKEILARKDNDPQ